MRRILTLISLLVDLTRRRLYGIHRFRVRGREYALMPVISGASPEGDDGGGEGSGEGAGEGAGAGDGSGDDGGDGEGDDDPEANLDEAGREAVRKIRQERREEAKRRREAEQETAQLRKRVEQLERRNKRGKGGKGDDDGDDEVAELRQKLQEYEDRDGAAESMMKQANLIAELSKPKYGLADAEAAAKLVEGVTFDDDHKPEDVQDAVDDLLERIPGLKRSAGGGGGNSPTNPKRHKGMTREEIRRLAAENPAEFNRKVESGEISLAALGG